MKREKKYKLAVLVLSAAVIIETFFLIVLLSKAVKGPVRPGAAAVKGKIAIVLDDWGYSLNNLPIVEKIKLPFTASVLPNLNYSREVAEELHSRGVEIILHLPMEPKEKYRLEKNTIMTSWKEASINKIIDEDLDSIAYAKGINNHMGSRATENSKTMEIVFKKLKKRGLFFLDSLVTSRSVCFNLSRKIGLPYAKRDIFLDNKEDPAYIKGQVNKLKLRAKSKGAAIGIGHDRKATLEVLSETMPQLEKEGYKLVFLSELVYPVRDNK